MIRHLFVPLSWILLTFTSISAETYTTKHFIIESPLDARYVNYIKLNAEAYYKNVSGRYFPKSRTKRLKIYFFRKQSDTQEFLNELGYKDTIGYGMYRNISEPVIYTHRLMDDGGLSGWGTLFHEITHHFAEQIYGKAPPWFDEGLATFLGEQTRIVKGKLTLGRPNPWRERILRDMIENGQRVNVKFLTTLSTRRKFDKWKPGYHVSRAFFYWLYESNLLDEYLKNVQQKGYGISVLEETAGKSYREINKELLAFIKSHCYPAAYYQDGRLTKDPEQKKKFFEKALEIKPTYQPALLELAGCFYKNKDYEKCRKHLEGILTDVESTKYRAALDLRGDSYYREKNYTQALKDYQRVWEYSDYYEYKHEVAYFIANCFHYLKDKENAKQWYKRFLEENWEPEDDPKWVTYAQDYLQRK